MNVTITPGRLSGKVTPPTSKSQGHRLLLATALAEGESIICGLSPSRDIEATTACICALGARVEQREDGLHVMGRGGKMDKGTSLFFDCGESGSTLRFLIPIALTVAGGGSFTGHGRLMERPLKPYFDIFEEKDISDKIPAIFLLLTRTSLGHLILGSIPQASSVSHSAILKYCVKLGKFF